MPQSNDHFWFSAGALVGVAVAKYFFDRKKSQKTYQETLCGARLHYFDGRGRAECIRWALAAAGVSVEEPLYTTHAQWNEIKNAGMLPLNQFPLLEVDGKRLTQSQACVRYIARAAGLYGENDDHAYKIDLIIDACCDFERPV